MKSLSPQEEHAFQAVIGHIAHSRLRQARTRAGLYGFFLIGALAGLVPALQYAGERAAASGFTDYMSLIASDGGHLTGSWSALMLSLLDSAPLMGIILVLLAFTVFAYCAHRSIRDRVFLVPHLIH